MFHSSGSDYRIRKFEVVLAAQFNCPFLDGGAYVKYLTINDKLFDLLNFRVRDPRIAQHLHFCDH